MNILKDQGRGHGDFLQKFSFEGGKLEACVCATAKSEQLGARIKILDVNMLILKINIGKLRYILVTIGAVPILGYRSTNAFSL